MSTKKKQPPAEVLRASLQRLTAVLQTMLADEHQFYRYVYTPKGEAPAECILGKADLKALQQTAALLRELYDLCAALAPPVLPDDEPAPAQTQSVAGGVIVLG